MFNPVLPHVLAQKLLICLNLDVNFVGWIVYFLTHRSQRLRVNGFLSELRFIKMNVRMGCWYMSLSNGVMRPSSH